MVDGVRSTSKTTGVFSSPSGSIDASDSTEIAPWASTPLVTIPVLLSTLPAPILAVVSFTTTLTALTLMPAATPLVSPLLPPPPPPPPPPLLLSLPPCDKARPIALVVASVSVVELTLTAPPALMLAPSSTSALALLDRMVTPIAAATLIFEPSPLLLPLVLSLLAPSAALSLPLPIWSFAEGDSVLPPDLLLVKSMLCCDSSSAVRGVICFCSVWLLPLPAAVRSARPAV